MPAVDPGKVGWLNRHAPPAGLFSNKQPGFQWRLARAALQDGKLVLSAAPATAPRAFDIAAEQPAPQQGPPTQQMGRLSMDSRPDTPQSEFASLGIHGNNSSAVFDVPRGVTHRSAEPHPLLELDPETLMVSGGTDEALVHYILFAGAAEPLLHTVVCCIPFCGSLPRALALVRDYVDLVVSGLPDMQTEPAQVAARVRLIVHTVLDSLTGLVLDDKVHAGLQSLANAVGALDDSVATALKVDVYKCHERLAELVGLTPAPQLPSPQGTLSARIQQLQSQPQLWIPPDLFLDREFAAQLAPQIAHLHRRFWAEWSPVTDLSLAFHKQNDPDGPWRQNPLMFDLATPHFLGALLINHATAQQLGPAQRGALLEQWILLGERLKSLGDIVGWSAIVTALCRMPLLRLRRAWAYVQPELRAKVAQSWGFEAFELEKRAAMDLLKKSSFRASTDEMGIDFPKEQCVPYFGDAIVSVPERLPYGRAEVVVNRLKDIIEGWHYYYQEQVPSGPSSDAGSAAAVDPASAGRATAPDPHYQALLTSFLRLNSTAPDLLVALEPASLAIEPRAMGHYLNYYYNQVLPLSNGTFLPLVFTEVAPSFRLFPRQSLMATPSVVSSSQSSKRSATRHNISSISTPVRGSLTRSNSFPPLNVPLTTGVRDVELGTREYMTRNVSGHVLVKNIRDLLNVGAKTHLVTFDIVFKSFVDDRHNSRTSSIIENLGRRSMMFDPRRQSLQSIELAAQTEGPPLNIVVKAASLSRLVDILVLGAGEFSPTGSTIGPPIHYKLDLPVHTETFFATFRSFCSPLELLSMLRTRFLTADGAALSILQRRQGRNPEVFPAWRARNSSGGAVAPSSHSTSNSRVVAQIYANILEAVQFWITEYFGDFADDAALRGAMASFIREVLAELGQPAYVDGLQEHAKRVHALFVKQSFRIGDVPRGLPHRPTGRHAVHLLSQPGSDSLPAIEQAIEEMDAIVADYFGMVSLRDWMQLFEQLELQSADTAQLFSYSQPTGGEDDIVIADIYTYLSSLYRYNRDEPVLARLPVGVRELVKLHNNLADYVCAQVADPLIHVVKKDRSQRMAHVLKMLGVLRTRMRFFDMFPDSGSDSASRVPSFLESAILAGILRPESRMFAQSWLKAGHRVAQEFGGDYDVDLDGAPNALSVYVPEIAPEQLRAPHGGVQPITPCIGWVIERLFEIVCFVPNMSVENAELINFDKHRYAFNLVKNIQTELVGAHALAPEVLEGLYSQYDYLVNPDPRLYRFDKRALREALSRETAGLNRQQLRQKVFASCVASELQKAKIEQRQYESLLDRGGITRSASSTSLRERRMSRSNRPVSTIMGSPPLVGGLFPGQTPAGSSGSHAPSAAAKSRMRFGAGLLKAVRPLSMAFSSSAGSLQSVASQGGSAVPATPQLQQQPSVVPPGSLPDPQAYDESAFKQVTTIDLCEWAVKGPRQNNVLRLVPASGSGTAEYVLQAPSAQDAHEWVAELEHARKKAVARQQAQPGSTRVFGVPLQVVSQREGKPVPYVFSTLLNQIEERGLDEVGLYRISGSLASINSLKAAFDAGERLSPDDERYLDINTVAGCVKLYLRELPEPLLTTALFDEFVKCASVPADGRIAALSEVIAQLPEPNYAVLRRLIEHLTLVVQHEATNKMSTPNLAIVFSMNFLPPTAMDKMKAMQSIVNTMIQSHHWLFS